MTKLTFRIEFAAGTTETDARSCMEGLLGGEAVNIRTYTIAGVVTGWCDVPRNYVFVCDELDADDRVVSYA